MSWNRSTDLIYKTAKKNLELHENNDKLKEQRSELKTELGFWKEEFRRQDRMLASAEKTLRMVANDRDEAVAALRHAITRDHTASACCDMCAKILKVTKAARNRENINFVDSAD